MGAERRRRRPLKGPAARVGHDSLPSPTAKHQDRPRNRPRRACARRRADPPRDRRRALRARGASRSAGAHHPPAVAGSRADQSANGFSIRTPAIVCPALRSSERSRLAPAFAAAATMRASQNPILADRSDLRGRELDDPDVRQLVHNPRAVRRAERRFLERAAGIEPATLAWKARALPLCNAREIAIAGGQGRIRTCVALSRVGFTVRCL